MFRLLVALAIAMFVNGCIDLAWSVAPQPAPPGWQETRSQGEALRYEAGKAAEAVVLLQKVVDEVPGFPGGHFELAAAMREEAEGDYGRSMEARTPRFEKAIAHFRRALDLGYEPRGEAREQITQIQVRLMRFADAEQEARAWVQEQPDSPSAWWTLSSAVITQKRAGEGVRLLLDAAPKIGAAGQVEYARYLAWTAELPLPSRDDTQALLRAAQAIVDAELAAQRTSDDLTIVRAKILTVTAEHLEADPAREKTLRDDADRLIATVGR